MYNSSDNYTRRLHGQRSELPITSAIANERNFNGHHQSLLGEVAFDRIRRFGRTLPLRSGLSVNQTSRYFYRRFRASYQRSGATSKRAR